MKNKNLIIKIAECNKNIKNRYRLIIIAIDYHRKNKLTK